MMLAVVAVICLALAGQTLAAKDLTVEFDRDRLPLDGTWDVLREHGDEDVWQPEIAAALGPWGSVTVPGHLLPEADRNIQENTRFVWARRTFTLSDAAAGRDAVLKWNGIRFGATAWLNGRRLGHRAPTGPHLILIPRGTTRPGENQLVLRIPGWGGLPTGEAGFPLIPTGSGPTGWGAKTTAIYDDVWLEFYDRAYMKWTLAMPNVEAGTVTFRVWLDGAGGVPDGLELSADVRLWNAPGTLGSGSARAAAGAPHVDIPVAVPNAKPWTPQTPHLYVAELTAGADGRICDRVRFRFGMREIEVADGHYRLNGGPLWFRGSNLVFEWFWGDTFNREVKRYIVDEARAMNLNSFRTHTLPPPTSWLNVCDEHGTMILAEFPVLYNYMDFKFTPEEREIFHRNVLLDATGWVTKLWNHPSVVVWVLSNESRGDAQWEAGPYRDHVRSLDPTRPCMRTGDMKVGTAETTDMHTCGNYTGGSEGRSHQQFARAARDKDPRRTLTNTEYMNIFGPRHRYATKWLGHPDHPDLSLNFAEFAMEHTEAMRRLNFDGIFPYMYAGWPRFRGNNWRPDYPTPMAAALHSSMAPVLASLDLFDRNFRAGQGVSSRLCLINELPDDVPARVDLYVTAEDPLFVPDASALGAAVSRESLEFTLKARSIEHRQVGWRVPEREGVYYLAAVLRREGDGPVVSQRVVRAIEDRRVDLSGRRTVVLGADEAAGKWLDAHGVSHATTFGDGGAAPDVVLIWDVGKLTPADRAAAPGIRQFVEGGGRLIILSPKVWDWPELVDFAVGKAESSRAFAYPGTSHRILSGVEPDYLKRWNGLPGTIAEGAIEGDLLEQGARLLWVEDPSKTVALSLPLGRGEILISLLHIRSRVGTDVEAHDPVADRILQNMLRP